MVSFARSVSEVIFTQSIGLHGLLGNDAEIAAGLIESCNKLDSLLSKFNVRYTVLFKNL